MHKFCGLIHTDLKPENVLLEISSKEKEVLKKRAQIIEERLGNLGHIVYQQFLPKTPEKITTGFNGHKNSLEETDNNQDEIISQ